MAVLILPNRAAGVRPPFYGVNRNSPLVEGLLFFAPDGRYDAARGLYLASAQGTPTLEVAPPPIGQYAARLDSEDDAFWASSPAYLQRDVPLTLSCWTYGIGAATNYASYVVVTHNSANSSPWISYGLAASDAGTYRAQWNSGGSFANYDFATRVTGTWVHLVMVLRSGAAMSAWANGVKYQSSTTASAIAYGSGSEMIVGEWFEPASPARYANAFVTDVRIWGRALSDAEVWSLYAPESRWSLYWTPSRRVYIDLGLTPVTRAPGLGNAALTGAAGSLAFTPGDYIYSTATPDDEAVVELTDLQTPGSGTWTMKVRGRVN